MWYHRSVVCQCKAFRQVFTCDTSRKQNGVRTQDGGRVLEGDQLAAVVTTCQRREPHRNVLILRRVEWWTAAELWRGAHTRHLPPFILLLSLSVSFLHIIKHIHYIHFKGIWRSSRFTGISSLHSHIQPPLDIFIRVQFSE